MIILTDVANYLQSVLNSTSNPILNDTITDFVVATEGFHIDSIAHEKNSYSGNNFIPVFVGSMGGQFNPVPELKQAIYTIPVTFYYPVRFKDLFFQLGEYLIDTFVGQKLTINSNKVISNISVPQYGELQDIDFNEFTEWVNGIYRRKIDVMEVYMSMTFNLYLTNCASGFVYGNDVTVELSTTIDDVTLTSKNLAFDDGVIQSACQPQSEQEMGESVYEADGLPFATNYSSSFKVYVDLTRDNTFPSPTLPKSFFREVLKEWMAGKAQQMRFNLTVKINNDAGLTFSRICYLDSVNLPIQKGQLLTMTFTFSKAKVDETPSS